jgi:Rv0078B-related antitoxin
MASTLTPEYLAVLRRTSGIQKLRTAFGLYWSARKLKAARLRELHPEWSAAQVQQRVKEIFLHASS